MKRFLATIRSTADATPADRDRYLDFLRAASIVVVVLGHWLVAAVWVSGGDLHASSVLVHSPAARVMTWGLQVMPIFFLVGGVVGARSWRSARAASMSWADWMRGRAARLLRPSVVLLWAWAGIGAAAIAAGLEPSLVKMASQAALVPLWFLAVYLGVVAMTPLLSDAARRFGLAMPVALTVIAAAIDQLHYAGVGAIGWANFAVVWSACYGMGIVWADGRLDRIPGWVVAAIGLFGLIALVSFAGYPVSMVGVDGAARSNNSPPSAALVVLGWFQMGAVLAFAAPARRWLSRVKVWRAVVGVNFAVMTVYLWHLTVMVAAVGLLMLTDAGLSWAPLTGGWWATRPLWLAALTLLLLPVVAALAPVELSTPRPRALTDRAAGLRVALATVGASGAIALIVLLGAAVPLRSVAVAAVVHVAAIIHGAYRSPLRARSRGDRKPARSAQAGSPRRPISPVSASAAAAASPSNRVG